MQAAASDGSYFVDLIVVASSDLSLPRVSYRDRQYANDADGFNRIAERPPLKLILDGEECIRVTEMDNALPHSFSIADFAPEKGRDFLTSKGAL